MPRQRKRAREIAESAAPLIAALLNAVAPLPAHLIHTARRFFVRLNRRRSQ